MSADGSLSLHVYITKYSRGAVVKLTASQSDQPLVKFVIERKQGVCSCRVHHAIDGLFVETLNIGQCSTEAQFIEYAERECERIRTVLGGSNGPR